MLPRRDNGDSRHHGALDRTTAGRAAMTGRDYGLVVAAVAIAIVIVLLV